MLNHKSRRIRFSFGDYVVNSLNSDDATDSDKVVISLHKETIHSNPESSNLDKATQARLSAMAKQVKNNGDNGSLSMDYLEKVPAKQHNQITMSVAGDKLKELNTKMAEEIKNNSGETSTADILNETASDHIVYKNYDMSDLDQYIAKINTMTMLEAISLKNSIAKELTRLESCNTMIKAVDELRENFDVVAPGKEPTLIDRKNAGTDVDKQILTANYLDEYGYAESADEFTKLYDAFQPKLTELSKALEAHIASCSSKAASTKYMTDDFIHIITKKIENMERNNENDAYTYKSLITLRHAFEHRTDLEFLKIKLWMFVKNKTHMKNLAKAMSGTFSNLSAKLNHNFSEKTLSIFINVCEDHFKPTTSDKNYEVLAFLYFLNYVCSSEANSKNDAWVKVLVLNINDIYKNIWDIDMESTEYLDRMTEVFYPMLTEMANYLKNRKIKVSAQIQSQYDNLKKLIVSSNDSESVTEDETIEHVEAEPIGVSSDRSSEIIDVATTPVE